jgi:hypothetical protein
MEPEAYQLVRLTSGVYSVRSGYTAETFHPVVGPAAEAEVLYVRQLRLRERLAAATAEFVIWDVGLGAAGNPLTVLAATRDLACPIRLISFDSTLEPLRFGVAHADSLPYFRGYATVAHQLLVCGESCLPAPPVVFIDGARPVTWQLHMGDFPTLLTESATDAWPPPHAILFDAYSPATNPEMWTLPLFERLFQRLDPERPCALPTYSRSTLLRVTLLLAGFYVGTGRATGEKEETTIAANCPTLLERPLDQAWLGRARRSTSAEPLPGPVYRQAPLTDTTWDRLRQHPQFAVTTSAAGRH